MTEPTDDVAGAPTAVSPRRWLALGALALATLIIGLDSTVLTVALPTLAVDLHAGTGSLQWFSTSYTLALAAVLLPAGVLGDRYGRKKMLLGALFLFGAASVWCAFSTSSGELIASRALLGVAAAFVMPLGMALLPTLFPDNKERARAMTIWVTALGLGMPLGPLVGGYLLNNYWWGSAFLVSVPFVLVGAAAVAVLIPESRSGVRFNVDVPGVVLSSVGLLGLTYGFTRIGGQGWGDDLARGTIIASVVALAVFLLWQRRLAARKSGFRAPLIDLHLFGSRGFTLGAIALTLANFGLFGMFFATPQYFQAVLGTDALGSGLRLLPMIGGMVVGARLMPGRAGARGALMIGYVLLTVGLGVGAFTTVHSGYGLAAIWLVLIGIGMGCVMPAAMNMAMDELSKDRAGSGSALLQAVRQAGGTIGVAILGTVEATRYHARLGALNVDPIRDGVNIGVSVAKKLHDPVLATHVRTAFVSGMSLMFWACAAICAVATALVALFVPRQLQSGDKVLEDRSGAAQSVHVG